MRIEEIAFLSTFKVALVLVHLYLLVFRSRDLMPCDSASANRVAEEVYPTL